MIRIVENLFSKRSVYHLRRQEEDFDRVRLCRSLTAHTWTAQSTSYTLESVEAGEEVLEVSEEILTHTSQNH